jgi:hypothetical protein
VVAFVLLEPSMNATRWALVIAASLLVGWWACTSPRATSRSRIQAPSSGTRWSPSGSCCGW